MDSCLLSFTVLNLDYLAACRLCLLYSWIPIWAIDLGWYRWIISSLIFLEPTSTLVQPLRLSSLKGHFAFRCWLLFSLTLGALFFHSRINIDLTWPVHVPDFLPLYRSRSSYEKQPMHQTSVVWSTSPIVKLGLDCHMFTCWRCSSMAQQSLGEIHVHLRMQ